MSTYIISLHIIKSNVCLTCLVLVLFLFQNCNTVFQHSLQSRLLLFLKKIAHFLNSMTVIFPYIPESLFHIIIGDIVWPVLVSHPALLTVFINIYELLMISAITVPAKSFQNTTWMCSIVLSEAVLLMTRSLVL